MLPSFKELSNYSINLGLSADITRLTKFGQKTLKMLLILGQKNDLRL